MGYTKSFTKWLDRIESGVFSKSETNQFAAAISRRALGYQPHGRRITIDDSEAEHLYVQLQREPVRLTDPHTQQGITWFANHAAKALEMSADEVLDIVSNFSHFTWDGTIETTGPYYNGTLPVWTLHLTDGRVLKYYNGAWQSQPGHTSWWWVREHVATEF